MAALTVGKPELKMHLMACLTQDQNEGWVAPWEMKFYGLAESGIQLKPSQKRGIYHTKQCLQSEINSGNTE